MTTVMHTEGLNKRFSETVAVDRICLSVPEVSIYALVGTTSAAKTTLIKTRYLCPGTPVTFTHYARVGRMQTSIDLQSFSAKIFRDREHDHNYAVTPVCAAAATNACALSAVHVRSSPRQRLHGRRRYIPQRPADCAR